MNVATKDGSVVHLSHEQIGYYPAWFPFGCLQLHNAAVTTNFDRKIFTDLCILYGASYEQCKKDFTLEYVLEQRRGYLNDLYTLHRFSGNDDCDHVDQVLHAITTKLLTECSEKQICRLLSARRRAQKRSRSDDGNLKTKRMALQTATVAAFCPK